MNFQEYKTAFEEILEVTEEIITLCNKEDFDNLDEPFEKREKLFQKLSYPENLTEEEIDCISNLRDKIQEQNDFLLEKIKSRKEEIKKELFGAKQESRLINAYKIPQGNNKSIIFDSKE